MTNKRSISDVLPEQLQLETKYVDISQIVIGYAQDILKIPALGSCIGLTIFPRSNPIPERIAVMGHIMLPESHKKLQTQTKDFRKRGYSIGKYSDQAIPVMLSKLEKLGYSKNDLDAKMVGGAKMFSKSTSVLDIGKENIRVTKNLLQKHDIPIIKQYTGGDKGMNIKFIVSKYKLVVTPTGGSPIVL